VSELFSYFVQDMIKLFQVEIEKRKHPRCVMLFWGVSGAGLRCTHRIAAELTHHFGRENIALSINENNAWLDRAGEVSAEVDIMRGTAGRNNRLATVLNLAPRFIQLMKFIKRFRADIVVVPMNFAQAWPLGRLISMTGVRLIYVLHDAKPHPGDYAPILQILSQRGLFKAAHGLVALSEFVGENARSELPKRHRDALEIVPLGMLVQRQRSEPRTLGKGPIRFLFLGRLLEYKGLDTLAMALHRLKDRDDWRLTIAGNGRNRDSVIRMFQSFGKVDLSRLDWLLESEVDHLLDTHDVILCPYLEASQSGVIAEACGVGLPCVVTPVGALAEQIGYGKAGWIASASTSTALADCLLQVLDNRELYSSKSEGALKTASQGVGASSWADVVMRFSKA
jgi:glycosyltransferase involved in cell wall biosynthesis